VAKGKIGKKRREEAVGEVGAGEVGAGKVAAEEEVSRPMRAKRDESFVASR
jgi:hypothetical protein